MNTKRFIRRRRGLTLIETTIALMVITFVVLIFSGSVIIANRASFDNGQYAQAISLAQHKIDQMRAVGYGRVWDIDTDRANYTELNDAQIVDDTPSTLPYSFITADSVAAYLPNPTARINLQRINPNVVKMTVTLTWTPNTHESRRSTLALTGLISNVE